MLLSKHNQPSRPEIPDDVRIPSQEGVRIMTIPCVLLFLSTAFDQWRGANDVWKWALCCLTGPCRRYLLHSAPATKRDYVALNWIWLPQPPRTSLVSVTFFSTHLFILHSRPQLKTKGQNFSGKNVSLCTDVANGMIFAPAGIVRGGGLDCGFCADIHVAPCQHNFAGVTCHDWERDTKLTIWIPFSSFSLEKKAIYRAITRLGWTMAAAGIYNNIRAARVCHFSQGRWIEWCLCAPLFFFLFHRCPCRIFEQNLSTFHLFAQENRVNRVLTPFWHGFRTIDKQSPLDSSAFVVLNLLLTVPSGAN